MMKLTNEQWPLFGKCWEGGESDQQWQGRPLVSGRGRTARQQVGRTESSISHHREDTARAEFAYRPRLQAEKARSMTVPLQCVPLRLDRDEVVRVDVLARHFHASRAEILRPIVCMGIKAFFEAYQSDPVSIEDALAAGSRRAKTAKRVECEASQSGPKGNAQTSKSA
jgi:hypothetical protein